MTKKNYRQSNFYEGEGSQKTNTEGAECQTGEGGRGLGLFADLRGAWQERGGGVNEGGRGLRPQ